MSKHLSIFGLGCVVTLWAAGTAPAQSAGPKPTHRWTGFGDWVTSVAVSPDGRLLAAGSYDTVRLWDLAGQREVGVLKTRCGYAHALQFSSDAGRLIVGGYQQVQVWDVGSSKKTATLRGCKGYVRGLSLSPDGAQLAAACEDRSVHLWNWPAGDTHRTLGPLEYPVLGVAWSPDGKHLATAAGDETRLTQPGPITLWNAASGEATAELPAHEKAATAVAFSPDGSRLLSTGLDELVRVCDLNTGNALRSFDGHSRPTNDVLFPGRPEIAISCDGGRFQGGNEIKVLRLEDVSELLTLAGHEGKVTAIDVSPDGRWLASGSYDQTVAVWDLSALLPSLDALETAAETTTTDADAADAVAAEPNTERDYMRIGIIGLDTSHVIAFTKLLNAESPQPALAGMRVVIAYPQGSPDIESSTSRVPGYTEEIQKLGVEIVDSIDELVARVDAVLLETNDGRPHLEQALPVLKAGKPVFIDKPIAGSLVDCIAIQEAARRCGTPMFSSSSMRFLGQVREVRNGDFGAVVGCDTFSPCSLEPTHPDLYWYGLHGTGTFRGLRKGARGYGGTAYTEKRTVTLGPYPGYQPLVESIVHFFKTGEAPVAAEETLEIYAFMSAADESKRRGGVPVDVRELIAEARREAEAKLRTLLPETR